MASESSKETKSLTREDLILLMDSYKNTIALNTTILEQQKNLVFQIDILAKTQKDTFEIFNDLLEEIKKMNHLIEINKSEICGRSEALYSRIKEDFNFIQQKQSNQSVEHVNLSKEHGNVKNHLYVIYVALGTMIASLISFIISTSGKIDTILRIIEKFIK